MRKDESADYIRLETCAISPKGSVTPSASDLVVRFHAFLLSVFLTAALIVEAQPTANVERTHRS